MIHRKRVAVGFVFVIVLTMAFVEIAEATNRSVTLEILEI